jgi:hypothetical protein
MVGVEYFNSIATADKAQQPEITDAKRRKVPSDLPRQVVSNKRLKSRNSEAAKL